MDIEYGDVLTEENCIQLRLPQCSLFISQFVNPVGVEGMGKGDGEGELIKLHLH